MPKMPAIGHIRWLTWGADVFDRAAAEDKLILLDSGATWCHWCHVMDHVTYEDGELAELIDSRFLAVRIDRDRMPEIDARLQRSPALSGTPGAGGWPLTVVMTPQGHVLFKATFLPPRPQAAYGAQTGLIDILRRLDQYWRNHRDDLEQASAKLALASQQGYQQYFSRQGELSDQRVADVVAAIKANYDPQHGGFGDEPKFFSAPGMELLLAWAFKGDPQAGEMVLHTLDRILHGGVYDQLIGGFHRYSVDRYWHVPHFEKMASDNAAMLTVCSHALAISGQPLLEQAIRETLAWVAMTLTDPDGHGFYASRDADAALGDDGDFFTWTMDEVRRVLGADADVILRFYGVDDMGDVHARPGRNVLHIPKTIQQFARQEQLDEEQVRKLVAAARLKLFQARQQRPGPAVDKTIFADINGMMIDAHLWAFERLADERARQSALRAADAMLAELRDESGVFAHYREGDELRGVGLLADQAWMGKALVHAYAVTAQSRYLQAAITLADYIIEHLTAADGGFVSGPPHTEAGPSYTPAACSWEDGPVRSASSIAAQMLTELAQVSAEEKYRQSAGRALSSMAGAIAQRGADFLAGCALAIDEFLHGPRVIMVVGPSGAEPITRLAMKARRSYMPGAMVMVLDGSQPNDTRLLERLGYTHQGRPIAYVCRHRACLEPAFTPEELQQRIEELAQQESISGISS